MSKEQGLTIIELLLTITILVATVTAVLSLGNRAVSNAGFFSAQTQAVFLAKEVMEILEDSSERSKISGGSGSPTFWKIDYLKIEGPESEADCYKKVKVRSDEFFGIGGVTDKETSFARCVKAVQSGDNLEIEVDVAFEYQNNSHTVTLYRIFYD
jgi:Tfp pilus assembly protein PilV